MAQETKSEFRGTKPLPYELRQHCAIYFEEKLYSQALTLLLHILSYGTPTHAPAYVPAPQHLALAATLLVHPTTTTKAKSKEEKDSASAALQLLRLTLQLVGPISSKLNVAFTFTHFDSSRHGRQWKVDEQTTSVSGFDDDETPLNLDLAKSKSIWSRAEDFWHAVGWTFNCSVLYPRRWERWQIWLEYMCLAMEMDWIEREKMVVADSANKSEDPLKDSLIWKFIDTDTTGYGRNRRILRAIFADGSATALTEFREVFKNELKEQQQGEDNKTPNSRKRTEVNIDEDEYGDYLFQDEDDSDVPDKSTRTRPKRARRGTRVADLTLIGETAAKEEQKAKKVADDAQAKGDVAAYGGFHSLELRQRLLSLLIKVSLAMPKTFMPTDALYHLFVENIRHLPLPIFQTFVSPQTLPWMTVDAQSTLCETLILRMRESAAPNSNDAYLHQQKLQECYLPYSANTTSAVDNAKYSILLEALIILLARNDALRNTPILREAVMTGNERRIAKAEAEIRRNKTSRKMEGDEWSWLVESADRLLYLVEELLPQVDVSDED
ncbi:hypothetical protein TMatcc_007232 [Talaromyces marneffei ATCC 18224]|uniref:Uncharacterized protein n=1 Tax=Talaromyces marneffei (strain ATCC 18224 / CBS 334.59 / QM 7333) TaxID=441960 RepID=B6QFC1_TALMQ|nr:conserved hypothetical protein [Talaromyces marneffei ATCC 18224]KAE8553330.1 hypothetical protein EYB25_004712 [Talaromyces marneffei]